MVLPMYKQFVKAEPFDSISVPADHMEFNINSAVVIPALNPVPGLVEFVQGLIRKGIPRVIIVNDGSSGASDNIFGRLKQMERCTVLVHEVNRGKGRALKTAFSYFMDHCSDLDGVVTADADGQHGIEDICRICRKISGKCNSLILGVRNFKDQNVPRRSYVGNTITSRVFQLLFGSYICDTQTGLRGIPKSELGWMTELEGERFDYEMNMLIEAVHRRINILMVPIKTLYYDNNSGSNYNTVVDSFRISKCFAKKLMRYSWSSVFSAILDILVFSLLDNYILALPAEHMQILASTLIARITSSSCNYAINRKLVFWSTGKIVGYAARFLILWISVIMASFGMVYSISRFWRVNVTIIKILVDIALAFVIHQVKRRWVFQDNDDSRISY